jgi:hypothetical protein
MFSAQVACDGCHQYLAETERATSPEARLQVRRRACVTCHGTGYDDMLDDWLRVIAASTRRVGKELSRAESFVGSAPTLPRHKAEQAKRLFENAKSNYEFVIQGRGAHNVEYAALLLKGAANDLDSLYQVVGTSRRASRDKLLGTPDGYCTQLCHTRLGLPDALNFEYIEFPHSAHVTTVGVPCTRCHSPEKHKMRIISREGCQECHHQEQDIACGQCHVQEQNLYAGSIQVLGLEPEPDIMAQAEVECLDCHDPTLERQPFEQARQACLDCHEEGYDEMLVEWYQNLQALTSEVILLQDSVRTVLGALPVDSPGRPQAMTLFEAATALYQKVEKGKPIHNQALAEEMLNSASEQLQQALRAIAMQENL